MHQPPTEGSFLLSPQNSRSSCNKKLVIGTALIVTTIGAFIGGFFIARNRLSKSNNNNDISNLGIANNSSFVWKLTKSSGSNANCTNNGKPATCAAELATLAQEWVGIQTTSGWYDLEYDVFDSNNNYLGHFGVSITPTAVTVSNEEGVKVVIGPYQNNVAQSVNVSPNNATCVINHDANPANNSLNAGVNQSGFEWGNNVAQINPPTCNDIDTANEKGYVSLRVPFKLEYASTDGVTINPNSAYVQNYLSFIKQAIAHGNQVIVEPHNYMQFNNQPITTNQCQKLIGQAFVGLFKSIGFNNIIIEAMNEPTNAVNPGDLATCYDALIKSARSEGYTGPIIIEGNTWGTPSVLTNGDGTPSALFNALKPLLTNTNIYGNVQLGIHTYFNGASGGGDGLSECVSANNALDINRIPALTILARQNGIKISVTEIGVINTSNCNNVLTEVLDHLYSNQDVFSGYNWWVQTPSNPEDWGPNGYPLLLNLNGNDPRYAIMKNEMPNNIAALPLNPTTSPSTSSANSIKPSALYALPARAVQTMFGAIKNMGNYLLDSAIDRMQSYSAEVVRECPSYFTPETSTVWQNNAHCLMFRGISNSTSTPAIPQIATTPIMRIG